MGTESGWTPTTLGKTGSWLSGGTPSKANKAYWVGEVPWVSPKDMKVPRIGDSIDHVSETAIGNGTKLAPEQALLVVVRGMILAHTFPVALTTRPVTFNQDIKALVPAPNVEAEFLLYWLQNQAPKVLAIVNEATHGTKRVPTEALHGLGLMLPPLPEQRKIAAILSSVDEAIAKTQAVIDQVQVVKKGLMQELLTRGIPGRHTRFKQTPIGEVPEEWKVVPLETIAAKEKYAVVDGPFGSNLKSAHYRSSGIPVIQSGFVTTGRFLADEYVYVEQELFENQRRSAVRAGDIVMAKIGARSGTAAILPQGHPESILAGNSLKLTVDEAMTSAQFVLSTLHWHYATGFLDKAKTTTAQPALSLKSLRKIPLPLPPREEQDKIVGVLSSLDDRILCEEAALMGLANTKRGLMSVLLTGEVRVQLDEEEAA